MSVIEIDIIKAITEELAINPEDLDKGALLREDLDLGPIELNDLIHALSLKFNIAYDPAEVQSLKSVEDLINLTEDGLIDSEL